jgi:hypothetical protein
LPRRRPNDIAMLQPIAGPIPLPRARPADAPAASTAPTVQTDAPVPGGYNPGLSR